MALLKKAEEVAKEADTRSPTPPPTHTETHTVTVTVTVTDAVQATLPTKRKGVQHTKKYVNI